MKGNLWSQHTNTHQMHRWHNLCHMTLCPMRPRGSSFGHKWEEQMLKKETPTGSSCTCSRTHRKICLHNYTQVHGVIYLFTMMRPHHHATQKDARKTSEKEHKLQTNSQDGRPGVYGVMCCHFFNTPANKHSRVQKHELSKKLLIWWNKKQWGNCDHNMQLINCRFGLKAALIFIFYERLSVCPCRL